MSTTIWTVTQDEVDGHQFIESWVYESDFGEEEALDEIASVMFGWNNLLRPGQHPRQIISFVLEEVVKC